MYGEIKWFKLKPTEYKKDITIVLQCAMGIPSSSFNDSAAFSKIILVFAKFRKISVIIYNIFK